MTFEEYQSACVEADNHMKANNGHSFVTILKTRCQYCNASPKVKTRCRGWFQTFIQCLSTVLQERGVIVISQPVQTTESTD